MNVDAAWMRLLRIGLPVVAGSAMAAIVEPAPARTIDISKGTRHCVSTSIAPSNRLQNAAACIAHNSCGRTIYASFDAYPLHSRKTEVPIHARVSHWIKPGDSEVFGWNSANPTPAPECRVLETHY
jgi:hypothetical protein